MEVINSSDRRRTILLVADEENDLTELCMILETKYRVFMHDNRVRDFEHIKEQAGNISVAIICAKDAAAENFGLFEWLKHDSMLVSVPMLIYCGYEDDISLAEECLKKGAVDIITPPLHQGIILNRIKNAIHLKDSATFFEIERMLKELPSLIYLKDEKGRYVFSTHYWHHLDKSNTPDWTIRGKTDVEIRKDKENAIKAMESDKALMASGKGTSYIIEINEDGIQEYLEIIKEPVRDDAGNITGIIALINNVTEKEQMRISLEEKAMKDELTGADNRRCFEQFITGMEKGCQFPISFISADCNNLKKMNDTYGHLVGDEYIRMAALLFKTVLPKESRIFRTGGDEFILVLPETDISHAEEYIHLLKNEENRYSIYDKHISISYGVACLTNLEDSVRDCLDLADKRMYADKKAQKQSAVCE